MGNLREMSCGICGLVVNNFIQIKKRDVLDMGSKDVQNGFAHYASNAASNKGGDLARRYEKRGEKVFPFLIILKKPNLYIMYMFV